MTTRRRGRAGHDEGGGGAGAPPRLDRFATLNNFCDEKAAGLGLAAQVVWFHLFQLAWGKDGSVRGKSTRYIAGRTGLRTQTVQVAIRALIAEGLLEVDEPGGSHRAPVYHLLHAHRDGPAGRKPSTER